MGVWYAAMKSQMTFIFIAAFMTRVNLSDQITIIKERNMNLNHGCVICSFFFYVVWGVIILFVTLYVWLLDNFGYMHLMS